MKLLQRFAPIPILLAIYLGSYGLLRSGTIVDSGLLRLDHGTGNQSATTRLIFLSPKLPEQANAWANWVYFPCRKADEKIAGIGVLFYRSNYVF